VLVKRALFLLNAALAIAILHLISQVHLPSDIGKYSFVNRSITDWNKLPEGVIGTSHSKTHIFKKRVRKGKTSEGK
jgi:hypothetical protein